ncbi:MAG TPA: hypothetical protein VGS19_22195 [Streptosporangiaceae bacterium]|nr:hypothetical protein [Streptosporangiaceae bacterium]
MNEQPGILEQLGEHRGEVGLVLPVRRVPNVARVRLLSRLVERFRCSSAGGPAAPDPHTTHLPQTDALHWELSMTADWAARRVLAACGLAPAGDAAWTGEGTVLSLLPTNDITVHVIRRALPFALCGIPVQVADEQQSEKLTRYVRLLNHLLGLSSSALTVSDLPASQAVTRCQEEDLIVVSGHASTVTAVRQASVATVIGATRSCLPCDGHDITGTFPCVAGDPQEGWPGDFQV